MASRGAPVSTYTSVNVAFGRQVLDGGHEPSSSRALIAAIVVLVLLVVAGLWLTGVLRSTASIQDCVQAGRSNCAPIR
ncbi:MAG: hypothetical protein NVSMB18_26030 [Acetobacteraceae bacterium]